MGSHGVLIKKQASCECGGATAEVYVKTPRRVWAGNETALPQSDSLYGGANLYPNPDPRDAGSSILIELERDAIERSSAHVEPPLPGEAVFVGREIYVFALDGPILCFRTPIGNNEVPYPFAVTANSIYLLVDRSVIPRTLLAHPNQDPYDIAYAPHHANCTLAGGLINLHPEWPSDYVFSSPEYLARRRPEVATKYAVDLLVSG